MSKPSLYLRTKLKIILEIEKVKKKTAVISQEQTNMDSKRKEVKVSSQLNYSH
jgi:hypothetical protein